jgi:hypothetical protein
MKKFNLHNLRLLFHNADTLHEIKKVEHYFSSIELRNFLQLYEASILEKTSPYTYWGINFKDEKIYSVKFYGHIPTPVTTEDIKPLLPSVSDFQDFKHLISNSNEFGINNVGIAFEIKFKIGNPTPIIGFFFLTDKKEEVFRKTGHSNNISTSMLNRCLSVGINFEYNGNDKLYKTYYYFKNSQDEKLFFKNKFKIEIDSSVNLIEYSESDNFRKINLFDNSLTDIREATTVFSTKEKKIISYFNQKYKLINKEYGIYDDHSIKSVYFFDSKKSGIRKTIEQFDKSK